MPSVERVQAITSWRPLASLADRTPSAAAFTPIERPYLMVTFIPYYQDEQGDIWLERLWHRDFARHLSYLKSFTLLGPRYTVRQGKGVDLVRLDVPADVQLRVARLPHQSSRLKALINAPRTVHTIWSHVSKAAIVHSGVAGWPYPVGWIANASAYLQRKELLIYIESAPWRASPGAKRSPLARAWSRLFEAAASWSVNRATVSFYTHAAYRESLLTDGRGPGFVLPASWINEDDLISVDQAQRAWQRKRTSKRARFLFAARLTKEKGVEVLLEAVALLRERKVELDVDVIGSGELSERCRDSSELAGSAKLGMLAPIPYEELLKLLANYHAVLVPSLSDEQPRIVFDAYSQAVPVIASSTDGLRPYVFPGRTGTLVAADDATALADALQQAAACHDSLEQLGAEALHFATSMTHVRMHQERCRLMHQHLGV